MKNLTISIIIPTYNSAASIENCMLSIQKQNYSKNSIELIIVDGGSKDDTLDIVKKYKPKIIHVDPKKQNVEINKSIGIEHAKGDILLFLDHDNVMQNSNLITEMIKPFLENENVVGVETLRYHYDKKMSLLNKYIALFGVTDPLAFYLKKADRISYIYDEPDRKYNPINCGAYYLVNFTEDNLSTIGANGFMVRRKILIKYAKITDGNFYHIDVNVDLVRSGHSTYAFVKDSIEHLGGRGSVISFLARRAYFMRQFYFGENAKSIKNRRYSLYQKKDLWRLIYFVIIGATVIIPTIDSIRGYIKIRDKAWFIHPILCFGFVAVYSYVVLEHVFKASFKKF